LVLIVKEALNLPPPPIHPLQYVIICSQSGIVMPMCDIFILKDFVEAVANMFYLKCPKIVN
jgi:hypothetical protein